MGDTKVELGDDVAVSHYLPTGQNSHWWFVDTWKTLYGCVFLRRTLRYSTLLPHLANRQRLALQRDGESCEGARDAPHLPGDR